MDVGAYPAIDQSPKSVSKSLSKHDRTEQIRAAFGVGWRLSKVDDVALARYNRYLGESLSLPFWACYPESANSHEERRYRCIVVELIDPATCVGDVFDGIFCKVLKGKHELVLRLIELELPLDSPNYQLIESYWDWFWHWR